MRRLSSVVFCVCRVRLRNLVGVSWGMARHSAGQARLSSDWGIIGNLCPVISDSHVRLSHAPVSRRSVVIAVEISWSFKQNLALSLLLWRETGVGKERSDRIETKAEVETMGAFRWTAFCSAYHWWHATVHPTIHPPYWPSFSNPLYFQFSVIFDVSFLVWTTDTSYLSVSLISLQFLSLYYRLFRFLSFCISIFLIFVFFFLFFILPVVFFFIVLTFVSDIFIPYAILTISSFFFFPFLPFSFSSFFSGFAALSFLV